jgi:hypothetical protein
MLIMLKVNLEQLREERKTEKSQAEKGISNSLTKRNRKQDQIPF